MLKHVVKVEELDLVLGRMDLVVTIFEVRLDYESRRISILAGGRVITAGVPTFGLDIRNFAVLHSISTPSPTNTVCEDGTYVGDNFLDKVG